MTVLGSQIENMKLDKNLEGLVSTLDDDDEHARKEAARALGEIGTEKCSKYLSKALDDKSENVRAVAALAIGEIGDNNNLETKEKILKLIHDESWSVRCAALDALAKISGQKHLDQITEALMDKDPHVQQIAFDILESFREPEEKF